MSVRYVRTEPLDVLTSDGESLLLLPPDQVVRLSPIASAVFDLAAHPTTLGHLAAAVEERFGPPAESTTTVALSAVIDALIEAGALKQVDGV